MRRTTTARLTATALALTLGLGLAACSSEDTPEPGESASASASASANAVADQAALEKVEISGKSGEKPTVTLPSKPFTVTTPVARLVADGDGKAIAAGDVLPMHILVVSGGDGTEQGGTYDASPQSLVAGKTQIEPLEAALEGAHVGARIAMAVDNGQGTSVYAIEVMDSRTPAARAEGETVAPKDGLPTVTLADDGTPSLKAASGDAPKELVAQPLIKGDGKKVEKGDSVVVRYSGWLWDGTAFDSSWDDKSVFVVEPLGQAQVITGWNTGLVGQTVGSQVMLVVPPDQGYGDTAQGSIPANSTLVFVVDIVDAY